MALGGLGIRCSVLVLVISISASTAAASPSFARSDADALRDDVANDIPAAERSGFAIAVGFGAPFSGFGVHLGYYVVPPERRFAFVMHAGGGIFTAGAEGVTGGPAVGLTAMLGSADRWLLDVSLGVADEYAFMYWGKQVEERAVYAITPSLGYEWQYTGGYLLRAYAGLPVWVDAARDPFDEPFPFLGLAIGYKQ